MELTYDSDTNSLRLELPMPAEQDARVFVATIDGILDIGEGGRLIGIEFSASYGEIHQWLIDPIAGDYTNLDTNERAYIQLSPDDDGDFRSANLRLRAEYNAFGELTALVIPRHGDGYEITYPSGNQ